MICIKCNEDNYPEEELYDILGFKICPPCINARPKSDEIPVPDEPPYPEVICDYCGGTRDIRYTTFDHVYVCDSCKDHHQEYEGALLKFLSFFLKTNIGKRRKWWMPLMVKALMQDTTDDHSDLITAAKNRLDAIDADIATLQSAGQNINQRINTLENKADLAQAKFIEIEARLNALENP